MSNLIYLIVLVIDIIVVMGIINSSKDMEKKVLWIIAVIFLPLLGPVLYYVIGKK